jgi:hypothetical protein
MQYWGICDAGAKCFPSQQEARFVILGYLDPFEMRIVAEAHDREEALLYNHLNILAARIPRARAASALSGRGALRVK